jgi:hypothetical protein
MTAMRPSYRRFDIPTEKEIDFLEYCKKLNAVQIQRVFRNNKYLLRKYNFTQQYQIDDMRRRGIVICRSGINRYSRGVYRTCALSFLQLFAAWWSVPLDEMMSKDLQASDDMLSRVTC